MKGKHLIAGKWVGSEEHFPNVPVNGQAETFASGSPALVDEAVRAAEAAFESYAATSRINRAAFIYSIAEEIEARAEQITEMGTRETGLPAMRLQGERGRTVGQLKLFADHIKEGEYLDRRFDEALPEREPLPRPDLRMLQRPIGPVAVFGASNFPLAFSTAGGDTASALAAGCPVIVKGHDAHPGTSEIIAEAILAAIEKCNLDPGVFSLVQGGSLEVGQELVTHPLVRAVGFTGSLLGGRALYDLCCQRAEPIPFYGELGSVNPMFLLPNALHKRGKEIGKGWAASLTLGAGQFCTNPGIAILINDESTDLFIASVIEALDPEAAQVMLTKGIADTYRAGLQQMSASIGVEELLGSTCELRNATPALYLTTGKNWLGNEGLREEIFGPFGLIVKVDHLDEMIEVAQSLSGQLTCTLHLEASDSKTASALMPVLERKSGRLLANGFPTGVEVCDSMVHGGPYPATTNFGHTSVGTLAIRRFLRPVCYQNIPIDLLPEDIR